MEKRPPRRESLRAESRTPRPRVGISSCLLGEEVRYDGGHKRDATVIDLLGPLVEWVPVCPEVEMGLGVPRPPMRLVQLGTNPHLVTPATGADHTAAMTAWASHRLDDLAAAALSGYVLKSRSPSCGLSAAPLFDPAGNPTGEASGLFAAALAARFPDLPLTEETALADPSTRTDFLSRVLACHRAQRARRS